MAPGTVDQASGRYRSLLARSVLVCAYGPDPKDVKTAGRPFFLKQHGRVALSASGFVVSPTQGLVLTSASVLAPFLAKASGGEVVPRTIPGAGVTVHIDPATQCDVIDPIGAPGIPATIVAVRDCPGVRRGVARIARTHSAWQLGWSVLAGDAPLPGAELDALTAPWSQRNVSVAGVAVLAVPPAALLALSVIDDMLLPPERPMQRGAQLVVAASPYALLCPIVLSNLLSTGVVSGVIHLDDEDTCGHHEPVLLLTDCRCQPGSEGALVADRRDRLLGAVGMVMLPLRHRELAVELNLVIPMQRVLAAVQDLLPLPGRPAIAPAPAHALTATPVDAAVSLPAAAKAVALIHIGSTWASGIVVSPFGHVLTNKHVLDAFPQHRPDAPGGTTPAIYVRLAGQPLSHGNARVVWISRSQWDLALVHIPAATPDYVDLSPDDDVDVAYPGQGVAVVGHGLYSPSCGLEASWTEGVVSKLVRYRGSPILLETSALVHQGASGGLVVATRSGRPLGIITSNARHTSGKVIPSLNFAIPRQVLAPVAVFARTGSMEALAPLDERDADVQYILELRASLPLPEKRGPRAHL